MEEGLYLFGEQETDMEIYNISQRDIAVANGHILEICCNVKSFPRPSFKLSFKGEPLDLEITYNKIDNSFQCVYRKEPARYKVFLILIVYMGNKNI